MLQLNSYSEVNPTVTGYGTNSIKFPSHNNPTSIKITPDIKPQKEPCYSKLLNNWNKNNYNAAVGPEIFTLLLPKIAAKTPATIGHKVLIEVVICCNSKSH